jgi:hypothetical protein
MGVCSRHGREIVVLEYMKRRDYFANTYICEVESGRSRDDGKYSHLRDTTYE